MASKPQGQGRRSSVPVGKDHPFAYASRGTQKTLAEQQKDRDRRNRQLVKLLGLVDSEGRIVDSRRAKTDDQKQREARVELTQWIMDLHCAGVPVEEIANGLGVDETAIGRLVEDSLSEIATGFAKSSAEAHFAKYAFFHFRQIKRLDQLVERFMGDESATQYNATVTAERARSDLLDKVYRKGEHLGVIRASKVEREAGQTGQALIQALVDERERLNQVLAELEITVRSQTVHAKVKRAPKGAR